MFAKKGAAIIGSFLSEGALEDNFFSIDLRLLIVKRLYVMHSVFRGPGLYGKSVLYLRLTYRSVSLNEPMSGLALLQDIPDHDTKTIITKK